MARVFGVAVKEFAIGMGPKLYSRVSKKTGIAYSLRALPIGGFVSMTGEDEESDEQGALNKKPVWQRLIITASGALMNLIIGILLMSVLVISSKTLGSTIIFRFADENGASLSELSGLQIGDEIISVNGERVHIANELVYEVMREGTAPVEVKVIRNGRMETVPNVIFPTITEEGMSFGSVDFYVLGVEKTPLNVIRHAFFQSACSIKLIWQSLIDLITGKYGVEQMSGPVGVTTAIGEAAEAGSSNLLYLCAMISLNIGMFNLLPLPALDGGRIFFQFVELIRRKPIKPELEGYVHFAGIVILMLFMAFITYKDIAKLFAG